MKSRPGSLHIWVFSLLVWPVTLGGWVQSLQTRPTGSLSVHHLSFLSSPDPFFFFPLLLLSPHSAIKVTMVASCLSSGQGLVTHPSPCNTSAAYCRLSSAHSTWIVSFRFISWWLGTVGNAVPFYKWWRWDLGGGGLARCPEQKNQ